MLDLGNVVIDIDFHRVFRYWADAAQVDAQRFYDKWAMGEAYLQHEVGEIDFHAFTKYLSETFAITLSHEDWVAGWNAIHIGPFAGVVQRLPAIAQRYDLYAFTNTNATHTEDWRRFMAPHIPHFERMFVSNEIGRRKPDAASFSWVCEQTGHPPGDIVFLDDLQENIDGAGSIGMDARLAKGEQQVCQQLDSLLS